MKKQIDKSTSTFRHIYRENYNTTNIHHKQRPHITEYSLFQYETIMAAFNIKFRNAMTSLQVQCAFHARILRHHQQYQHSINQDIFSRCPYVFKQDKEVHQPYPFSSFYSIVPLNNVTIQNQHIPCQVRKQRKKIHKLWRDS